MARVSPYPSILFAPTGGIRPRVETEAPAFFDDLHLDQLVESIAADRDEYDLKPFFYTPLVSVDEINYRHEVFHDLDKTALCGSIAQFAERMRVMREDIAQANKRHYRRQKQSWFLSAVAHYCEAVSTLSRDLDTAHPASRALQAFQEYLVTYVTSAGFVSLRADIHSLHEDLQAVRYCLDIQGNRIQVRRYGDETDYSTDVETTFEKFQQVEGKGYLVKFPNPRDMNHIEAQVLDFVAELHPELFSRLDDYCDRRKDYLDSTIARFDREAQFYLAYLEHVDSLRSVGLHFCYPGVSSQSKEVRAVETFDQALATNLLAEEPDVVSNDFRLTNHERILVVSGANQGGKTTFARTFGQMHYLARLGVLVPGTEATLFLYDELFTHFDKEEDITTLSGKLQDDLNRLHDTLGRVTPNSIVILNEVFNSTTLHDALFLGQKTLAQIIELDLLCVCVTFVDELSTLSASTVSMVSTVVPDDPAVRTFKVLRQPADGLSYAAAIAEKYRLSYDHLRERLAL